MFSYSNTCSDLITPNSRCYLQCLWDLLGLCDSNTAIEYYLALSVIRSFSETIVF